MMAGATLAPAAIYVTGWIAHIPDPANPTRATHADGLPVAVSLGHDYHQGTATYNPQLGITV
jgi:hypothetical protein